MLYTQKQLRVCHPQLQSVKKVFLTDWWTGEYVSLRLGQGWL